MPLLQKGGKSGLIDEKRQMELRAANPFDCPFTMTNPKWFFLHLPLNIALLFIYDKGTGLGQVICHLQIHRRVSIHVRVQYLFHRLQPPESSDRPCSFTGGIIALYFTVMCVLHNIVQAC
jgi:hypothetical protein